MNDEKRGDAAERIDSVAMKTHEVKQGVYCLNCRYNLRGLDDKGDCPECGTLIMNRVNRRGWAADPTALRRVRAAINLMIIAGCLGAASAFVSLFWRTGSIGQIWIPAAIVGCVVAGCLLILAVMKMGRFLEAAGKIKRSTWKTNIVLWCGAIIAVAYILVSMFVDFIISSELVSFWVLVILLGLLNLAVPAAAVTCYLCYRLSVCFPLHPSRYLFIVTIFLLPLCIAMITTMALIEYLDWTVGLGLYLGFGNLYIAERVPFNGGLGVVCIVIAMGTSLWSLRATIATSRDV